MLDTINTAIIRNNRYAVLDVETANSSDKGSICAIGIVYVHNTQIVDSFYSLVKPLTAFSPMNIRIHGIKPEHVADAPTFEMLWSTLKEQLMGYTLICYNSSADIYPLERAIFNAGMLMPNIRYACALELTKRLIALDSYKLSSVADYFGISFSAHNALEDAFATARILLRLCELNGVADLTALMRLACRSYQYTWTNAYDPSEDKARSDISYEAAHTPLRHGNSTYFLEKSVVFSGILNCAGRDMAQQAVSEMGGMCKTSVSRKTDIVVIGFYDQGTLLPGCQYGRKLQQAINLRDQGYPIEIIDENDFLEIINDGLKIQDINKPI